MKRDGVRKPKFADRFAVIDFEAEPLPVLSLYPPPPELALEDVSLEVCGLDQHPRPVAWSRLAQLPAARLAAPLICQIFNWSATVEWRGVRLVDVLEQCGLETHPEGYYAIGSRDGMYFEVLSRDEARDPRVLLATALNGAPLPVQHGGPLRLVVPFLQGYKSVKWVGAIKAYRHNPIGIKRLLGQSRTARLNGTWKTRFGITPPAGRTSDPPSDHDGELAAAPAVLARSGCAPVIPTQANSPEVPGAVIEIMAIVRPERHGATQRALEEVGIVAYTVHPVLGRSRQRGVRFPAEGAVKRCNKTAPSAAIQFLPKLLFMIVVDAPTRHAAIRALTQANRSGDGQYGDGKIFVLDVTATVRLRMGESAP